MILDLHVHTRPLSPDSELDVEEAIEEAKKQGLNGICFTEHNKSWDLEALERLRREYNFLVLSGVEVDTTEGHILVYGLHRDFESTISIEDLRREVDNVGGIMVAAHPFRGFLIVGLPQLRTTPEQAAKKRIFQMVDGIEICNGKSSGGENKLAEEVCKRLNLKGIGGSDAHRKREIGCCVTTFENEIKSEKDLLRELKNGKFKADYFRRGETLK